MHLSLLATTRTFGHFMVIIMCFQSNLSVWNLLNSEVRKVTYLDSNSQKAIWLASYFCAHIFGFGEGAVKTP